MSSSLLTSSIDLLETGPEAAAQPGRWLAEHRDEIRARVAEHGAVRVRGLGLADRAAAGAAIRAVLGEPLTEREGFAPRETYAEGVYSSSEWPPDQPMCMHNELSYAVEFPALMAFACLTAPTQGGVTALADTRAVLAELPARLVARFETTGWKLTRGYNPLVGVDWKKAFGTSDIDAVERYCEQHAILATWDVYGGLNTSQRRAAVIHHPVTGDRCWFNQIAFLNEWTMAPEVREFLVAEFGPEGLPFNTFYGDGEPLDRETVDLINEVYEKHTLREPWERGDLMVVDNIRMAHSREPYRGDREIVVGLGEATALADCRPTLPPAAA
ncbi:TauD/TfdA family dioxygenase [Streptomyces huasconensis]|uniref:TauD/TfdA family dioxygenase n=1 Tax=Streptomyces huasconensis TaxID=1854574 RepID=UPI0033C98265